MIGDQLTRLIPRRRGDRGGGPDRVDDDGPDRGAGRLSNHRRARSSRSPGPGSPYSLRRAIPPSGKTSSRAWVARAPPGHRRRAACRAAAESGAGPRTTPIGSSKLDPSASVAAQPGLTRRIALEMTGVQLDLTDRARDRPSRTRHPVVAVVAAARRLPALAHACGQPRQQQVVRRAVEHVAASDDEPTVLQRGEVDESADERPRIRHDLAVHAQPRHSPVGVDR